MSVDTRLTRVPLDVDQIKMPESIVKRDGRVVPFDPERIETAISKCFTAMKHNHYTPARELTVRAVNIICARGGQPTVESVQDAVELTLQAAGEFEAAKHYILYRAEHARMRAEQPVPPEIKAKFDEADRYFPTELQKFQFFDKYSRFRPDLGRRETWTETVDRSVAFLEELVYTNVNRNVAAEMWADGTWNRVRDFILNMRAMPSMRLLAMAGPAARRGNQCLYNCCYLPVDSIDSFVETMMLSMSGCGVGFSVERKFVSKLPEVDRQQAVLKSMHLVEDSAEGWCAALREGLSSWFGGFDIDFDFRQVRSAGTPLKTKGGRASGPEPLRATLEFARERILARQGSYLRPLDAHDIMCSIGYAVVSGGVRRTALISLFDPDDTEMANCKVGDFETRNSQRWNANNSAVIPEDGINQAQFLDLWGAMLKSERGEPGLISRQAMKNTIPIRREWDPDMGGNPCFEIYLKPYETCNLSIAVARADDTLHSLEEKVEIATIIGTIQSLATHFPDLRPQWRENAERERLLGVDITGQRDCQILSEPQVLDTLRELAVNVNRAWAERFRINQSAAITCVKPSGNSSVLLDVSSGLHPRWSKYYIRRVRVSANGPVAAVLRDSGVQLIPEAGQDPTHPYTWVVEFPVKSPDGALTRADLSALDQFDYWKHVKRHWTEHNPSITVQYKSDEIIPLMNRVWDSLSILGGMSFLPYTDVKLPLLPYEEISREEYERRAAEFPKIDFSRLVRYEVSDETTAAQELACVSGLCEVE